MIGSWNKLVLQSQEIYQVIVRVKVGVSVKASQRYILGNILSSSESENESESESQGQGQARAISTIRWQSLLCVGGWQHRHAVHMAQTAPTHAYAGGCAHAGGWTIDLWNKLVLQSQEIYRVIVTVRMAVRVRVSVRVKAKPVLSVPLGSEVSSASGDGNTGMLCIWLRRPRRTLMRVAALTRGAG